MHASSFGVTKPFYLGCYTETLNIAFVSSDFYSKAAKEQERERENSAALRVIKENKNTRTHTQREEPLLVVCSSC